MTPKEKAKQMVNKFMLFVYVDKSLGEYSNAKDCALIAVDEIIKVACDESDYDKLVTKLYWEEVKQEIEAL